MKLRFLLMPLCLLCSMSMFSANKMSFRSYGLDFGLSDNSIRDIAEDKYGFIWIATDEGLNRVAGSNVQKFYKSPWGQGLSGNELNCLIDDPAKPIMWIGTQRDGIVAFDYENGTFKAYHKISHDPASLITNDVTDFDFDPAGNLWISTYSSGIDCLDNATGIFKHFNTDNIEGLGSDAFWCLDYDEETGLIYGGHVQSGFSEINPSLKTATTYNVNSGLAGNEVWDVKVDDDCVWIATSGGLCRYDKTTHRITSFAFKEYAHVSRAILDMDSMLIVAMDDHGVLSFDKRLGKFSKIGFEYKINPRDLPDFLWRSDPSKLFRDSNGNIVVGSLYEGLSLLGKDTKGFSVLNFETTEQNSIDAAQIVNARNIAAGKHGVFFGTNGSGLLGNGRKYTSDIDVVAVHCEGDRLWCVGNENRLSEVDIKNSATKTHNIHIDGTRPVAMVSSGDSLWIGGSGGIIVLDKKQGKLVDSMDVDRNFIFSMEFDHNGRLWVGSFGDGVSVLNHDGSLVEKYNRRKGLPSNSIYDICVADSAIWLATGEGLVKVDGENLEDFHVAADSLRSIKSVVSDSDGNIWYATRLSIGVIPKKGEPMSFDLQLPVSGFNNASAAMGPDGRLYFGSNSGVLTFMPEYILSGQWLPTPMISSFIINGGDDNLDVPLNPFSGEEITLAHSQNNFTIETAPSDFSIDNFSFEYCVEGLDNKWYPVGKDGKVTLREMPFGKYTFKVRNSAMTDSEHSATASIRINIAPPIWLQWWAWMLYLIIIIAICSMIFFWYRNRLRRRAQLSVEEEKLANQKQLQDERVRFFTNVTHELRTPLTLINGPLEDLIKDNTLNSDDRWKLGVIHKNAQRLLSLVNQLLDYRKTSTKNKRLCVSYGNLAQAVQDVSMKFVELNRNPNVAISVASSVEDMPMYFDKEVLTMILDNLISNAMKYTETGMISISLAPEMHDGERFAKITVRDTGFGIGQDAIPYIFDQYYQENSEHQASGTGIGLALVKALVELHKGEISVESAKGVGSCFNILLPRDYDYPHAIHVSEKEDGTPTENAAAAGAPGAAAVDSDKQPDNIVALVVEDNPDILEYIRQSLSGMYVVKTATNGRDGLEIAQTDVPDIIVTDIMMPIMDGMRMTALLKENMATCHIPIIMLTAKDAADDRKQGYEAGVDSYITKPFNASLLIARINNIVSRRRMLTELIRNNAKADLSSSAKDEERNMECTLLNDAISKLDQDFIKKLDSIILDCGNPENVNLEYLTDALCMSRPTLYRKMKAVTGMSANEYIRHIRMKRAKELMLSGEYNITEIAEKLGFSSPGYFRETFKAAFGLTPTDYLKTLKRPS